MPIVSIGTHRKRTSEIDLLTVKFDPITHIRKPLWPYLCYLLILKSRYMSDYFNEFAHYIIVDPVV
jgi:hypothetical protein